jgi:hypothetical protein
MGKSVRRAVYRRKRPSAGRYANLKEWLLAKWPRFELPRVRRKMRHRAPPRFD